MSQPLRGHPNEAPAVVDLTQDGQPDFIRHADHNLRWMVWETVDSWRDPNPAAAVPGAEAERHLVRAYGPLPGRPSESGDLVLTVRRYSGREGWWISREPTALTGIQAIQYGAVGSRL
jgi:hypothetical protein